MKMTEFSWKTREGKAVYAVEWRPEGRTKAVIAFVHGMGEHCRRYDHQAEAYGKAGYATVAFDHPGFGRSEGKRGFASYGLLMEQIDRLLEEARTRFPGLPVFLYGFSMGGNLVMYYLIDRKPSLAGAVAGCPGLGAAHPVPALKIAAARLFRNVWPSLALPNGLDLEKTSHDPESVRRLFEDKLNTSMISARYGWDFLQSWETIAARSGEIALPFLMCQGTDDQLADPKVNERIAASMGPNATYKAFEGWYHELHNEPGKAEYFSYVVEWLDGRLAPPAGKPAR